MRWSLHQFSGCAVRGGLGLRGQDWMSRVVTWVPKQGLKTIELLGVAPPDMLVPCKQVKHCVTCSSLEQTCELQEQLSFPCTSAIPSLCTSTFHLSSPIFPVLSSAHYIASLCPPPLLASSPLFYLTFFPKYKSMIQNYHSFTCFLKLFCLYLLYFFTLFIYKTSALINTSPNYLATEGGWRKKNAEQPHFKFKFMSSFLIGSWDSPLVISITVYYPFLLSHAWWFSKPSCSLDSWVLQESAPETHLGTRQFHSSTVSGQNLWSPMSNPSTNLVSSILKIHPGFNHLLILFCHQYQSHLSTRSLGSLLTELPTSLSPPGSPPT